MKSQSIQKVHCRHIVIVCALLISHLIQPNNLAFCQTQSNFNSKEELHKKYIELRQSLVTDFMLGVGPDQGHSIPAWRHINGPLIYWGDGPMHLGFYIGLLAMEYKLLADNQLPTDQTIKELYYALNAIDRLDFYAETYYYIPGTSVKGSPSLNGFLIRDDISNVTMNQIDALNTNPNLINVSNWKSDYDVNLSVATTTGDIHAMSKDHCAYLCTGLALVIKLLPGTLQYYENGVPKSLPDFAGAGSYSSTLRGEAINILDRIVNYLLSSGSPLWKFKNPVTNEPITLGGYVWDLSWGFYNAKNTWTSSTTYNPGMTAKAVFDAHFSNLIIALTDQQKRMWLNLAAASNCLNDEIDNTTMETLLNTYLDPGGLYNFEYIPPLNYILFKEFYDNGGGSVPFAKQTHASVLSNLLSQLNCLGNPHDYTPDPTVYGLSSSVPPGYGAYEWSSCGRLIEPQGRGKVWTSTQHSFGDFNGIDWMFFYNLYCLLQNTNPQYTNFKISERIKPQIMTGQSETITITANTYYFEPLEIEGTLVIKNDLNTPNATAILSGKGCENPPNIYKVTQGGLLQLGDLQDGTSSIVNIDSKTALSIESGATLLLHQNSKMNLMPNAILIVQSGATLHLKGSSIIEIHDLANICIDPGATIILENASNIINIHDFAVIGGEAQNLCQSCVCALPQELTHTGNGSIVFNCSFFMHFSLDPLSIIGSNVIWDGLDEKVKGEFIIMPGASLTIANSTLEFTEAGALYVSPGGKLIIDNTVLSHNTLCPQAFWKGIQVAGNLSEPQSDLTKQGYLEVRNGSEIRRAECGIINDNTFFQAIPSIGPGNNNTGGVIKVKDSYFINNKIAIQLLPYSKTNPTTGADIPNVTEIRTTVFETNDPLLIPQSFIKLNEVHGVKILGNSFLNSTPIINHTFTNRGTGIELNKASAFVQDYSHGPALPGGGYLYNDPNNFEGLYYGIYRKNFHKMGGTSLTMYPRPIKIDHCNFQDCFRSVYLWCGIGDVVTRNSFAVPAANLLNSEYPYGLYLNYSKGYWVEANEFGMGLNSPFGPEKGNFGIIVNNSHEEHNKLYNNIFTDLQFGINAQNNNRSLPDKPYMKGLQIKCNDFSDCLTDIVVTANQTGPLGIAQFQGYNTDAQSPAGNTFSFSGTNAWSDFNNYGVTNNPGAGVFFPNAYYHHSVTQSNYCNPDYNWRPCYFDPLTTNPNNTQYNFNKPIVCPSGIQTGVPNYSAMLASLQGHQQAIASLEMTLNIILDGGNTEGLSSRIQLALPWESYQVFGELVAQSPHISESVMVEVVHAVDLFSASMVKSLMLMNPHNIQSDRVMEALYNRSVSLPEYMIYEIMNAGDQPAPVRSLKAELAYLNRNFADTVQQIRRHYLLDTSEVNNTEMLLALDLQLDDVSSGWSHAWFLFDIMGADSAMAALQKIAINYPLTDAEYTIQQEYSNLMTITQWCNEHSDSLESMDPQWLSYLDEVAQSRHHFSAAMAIALLEHLDPEFHYEEEILSPSYSTLRRLPAANEKGAELTVFPNPAKTHITITYHTHSLNGVIQITDATGKVVLERSISGKQGDCLMDVQNLKSGLYFVQLRQNNAILASERLIITH